MMKSQQGKIKMKIGVITMNVLVACEESQRVCIAFRERGHLAFSCDIIDCSGGHPEWHIKQDVIPLLNGKRIFFTCDGKSHYVTKWDLIIAHPPCTYLCNSGNRWFNEEKYGDKARKRKIYREFAVKFFMEFVKADCAKIAIENPVGVMSTCYRKPDQIINPYQFGDAECKKTCLWLKGLPPLKSTHIIPEQQRKQSVWTAKFNGKQYSWNSPETARLRSQTFQGIANAMADQWANPA
jgi:hypothetical protein